MVLNLFQTNIPFLLNVLEHPKFLSSAVYTSFIDENPQLFDLKPSQNRAQKLLNYIGDVLVNGPSTPLVTDIPPAEITVGAPETPAGIQCCTAFYFKINNNLSSYLFFMQTQRMQKVE